MAPTFDNAYVSALQKFYNTVGAKYDTNSCMSDFHTQAAMDIVEAAGDKIKQGSYIVDLATGTGNVALVAASRVGTEGRVLGIDISETFMEQAKAKAEKAGLSDRIAFSHQDVTKLKLPEDFEGKKFHAMTCGSAIAMFPDTRALLRVAEQILKPGGVFVADMNAGNGPANLFLDVTVPRGFKPPFSPTWFSDCEGSLRSIFEGSAFEVTDMVVKDTKHGNRDWDLSTDEKLIALWTNIVEFQSWVSYGVEKLSKDVLDEAKADWIKRMKESRNDEGRITGRATQYIVVATLR